MYIHIYTCIVCLCVVCKVFVFMISFMPAPDREARELAQFKGSRNPQESARVHVDHASEPEDAHQESSEPYESYSQFR